MIQSEKDYVKDLGVIVEVRLAPVVQRWIHEYESK